MFDDSRFLSHIPCTFAKMLCTGSFLFFKTLLVQQTPITTKTSSCTSSFVTYWFNKHHCETPITTKTSWCASFVDQKVLPTSFHYPTILAFQISDWIRHFLLSQALYSQKLQAVKQARQPLFSQNLQAVRQAATLPWSLNW